MTFLYRAAITITRNQPYIDWANSFGDGGPELTAELADDRRTIYLVPESSDRPDLKSLLEEFWEQIFEEELASWMMDDERWPKPLTRDMFDAWFDSQVTDSVFDLTPDEPLTQADVDAEDLDYAVNHCAWCGIEIDGGAGRYVGFKLADRARFAHREGLAFPLEVGTERFAIGIMARAESEASLRGEDVVFRACTSGCEKALRKAVPRALRQALKAQASDT